MKNSVLLVFVVLISGLLFAQTPKQKIIDRTFVDFQLEQSIRINDHIYSIGTNNASQETYSALIKQDLDLNTEWIKLVYRGFFIPDKFQRLSHMVKTDDDNLIIGGSNGTFIDAASWIMKVDTLGNILWETDIRPNPFHEVRFTINNPQDGALIINREPPLGPNNITLFNLDSNGDSLWTRRLVSQNNLSLVSREGYLRSDDHFIHFIHEGGRAGHIELDPNGNLLDYVQYEEQGGARYLQVNAVYYEANNAYIAGRMLPGSKAAIMKLDDNMNILWAKEYPELTAFTGIRRAPNGKFIANGINTSGVYNNLATVVRLDQNCDPIKGFAYGQIPGSHTIPYHMIELDDHYLFTGYRIEQGWTTSYQIITDTLLNSSSCYQRSFDVSKVDINLVANISGIDYNQLGNEIVVYGPSADASNFFNGSFSEFEINQNLENSYTQIGDDCGGSCNGSINVTTIGGNGPYTYEWSDGQVGNEATGLCSGDELILLTGDQLGCFEYDTLVVDIETPVTPICLITVDTSSTNNEVIWEKPLSDALEGFTIYRETGGNYSAVGYVPYDSLSKFVDNTNGVNPNITSYRYKISTLDTCGNESVLSDFHESIHLTINQGAGGQANLIWDNYEGIPFSYNRIWKDSLGDGNWQLKDSVSSNIFTWTDPYLPDNNTNYFIEVLSPKCTSTKAVDHNSTRSNQTTIFGPPNDDDLSVNGAVENTIVIYPNPFNGHFTVKISDVNNAHLEVYSISGQLAFSTSLYEKSTLIELSDLDKGIYLVKVVSGTNVFSKKVVKR